MEWKLGWVSAYRDRKGKEFLVESGAGIKLKRMELQIIEYVKKIIRKRGYL